MAKSSDSKLKILNKRAPLNPRYSHIKCVIDSGLNVRKYLESLEEFNRNFKIKPDEIFKRIKLDVFVNLVIEVFLTQQFSSSEIGFENDSSLGSVELQKNDKSESPSPEDPFYSQCLTSRSTLESVIRGIGEIDIKDNPKDNQQGKHTLINYLEKPQISYSDKPYLILDIRNRDDYEKCHIISAASYPAIMLNRAMNYESADMLRYKNVPGRIVILYDEDETKATKAATILVQRGWDNIYVLSGGLKVAAKRFPEGLLIGLPYSTPLSTAMRLSYSQPMISSDAFKIEEMSITNQRSNHFTHEDINFLKEHLSNVQQMKGSTTSRYGSSARSLSNLSSKSSCRSTAMLHTTKYNKSNLSKFNAKEKKFLPWK